MKIYNFRPIFDNFNENFAISSKFFKKFLEYFEKQIWVKMYKYAWIRGRSPEASEITKNFVQKSMET